MVKVGDWVGIVTDGIGPVEGYGRVNYIYRVPQLLGAPSGMARYTIESLGVFWHFWENELVVLDPEKTLGEDYFA